MSIRITVPRQDVDDFMRHGEPILFVIWHNRLFMAAELFRRYRSGHPIHALISASRDGAWLAAFFSACGMRAVRGSSSRLGHDGARALIEVLRNGNDIGITPDGPRGPAYVMKPGALIVARRGGTMVVLVGIDFESSWRLPSWDGFHIPKPFSRMHLRIVISDPRPLEGREEGARRMGEALVAINPDRKPAPLRRQARP
jgi:lysophospholipid acyltransferase (LPLAT)-like uncharacterized protein